MSTAAQLIVGIGSSAAMEFGTSSQTVSAPQIAILVAEGGAFLNGRSVVKDPSHGELLVDSVVYKVQVGTEQRAYVIYSAKYALTIRG